MSDNEYDPRERSEEAAAPDRLHFSATPEQWQALLARLDQPAREIPRLRRLMSEPSILERED